MSFERNKYLVIKKAIDPVVAKFVTDYFKLKKNVAKFLFDNKYFSPFEEIFGVWSDTQVPGTYAHYADTAMETLLMNVLPIMEKKTKLKLIPTYSYARIYQKGDILHRHIDRFSCEISTTLNLGGDQWPIYLEPSGKKGLKGIKINLNPGDMLVYKGNELEHWREEFNGKECIQVFLHYNNANTKESELNKFDTRPFLGLPTYFKKNK